MKNTIKLGDLIKEEWKNNNGFRSTWVRQIDRETKTQFISESGRGSGGKFSTYCATRFFKKNNFIAPRNTRLSNPDGKITLTKIQDLKKDLICRYTYKELFETDLRELQSGLKEVDPLCVKLRKIENKWFEGSKNWDETEYFKAGYRVRNVSEEKDYWNYPLVQYLEKLFGVTVYRINEKVREHNEQSKLYESITLMHINYFGGIDNKVITLDEGYHNRTIGFWLFEDKLIFQYEDGKETW